MFENVFKKLRAFARKSIEIVKRVLVKSDKVATQETIQSLRQETIFNVIEDVEINIYGSKSFEYIEQGRAAGAKMPPEGVLLAWMASKGIPKEKEFAVRRSISVKGIEPVPVIEMSFIEITREFNQDVSENLLENISEAIAKAFKKGFKFPSN